MTLPFPHKIYHAVTDITPEALHALGVRGLLLDIDGTLMRTRDAMPPQPVLEWIRGMKAAGIALFIFSNNRHYDRVKAFSEAVDLPWLHLAKKPRRRSFFTAAGHLGLSPAELAVVGDQTYTDILGARRFGCKALLVQSTDTYLPYFWPRRLLELPFRREKP
ncbi:MAG: YqeG family HAD IIIA-type phosphatase [Clostridiaceae bacterium]|nr:YqeG family HAD IIIA-type phosphatase [Clostridiaceae bacterium]